MIGMLWYDNTTSRLRDKIQGAVDYYEKKYGAQATIVYCNPRELVRDPVKLDGVVIKPSKQVLPHHIWVGKDE